MSVVLAVIEILRSARSGAGFGSADAGKRRLDHRADGSPRRAAAGRSVILNFRRPPGGRSSGRGISRAASTDPKAMAAGASDNTIPPSLALSHGDRKPGASEPRRLMCWRNTWACRYDPESFTSASSMDERYWSALCRIGRDRVDGHVRAVAAGIRLADRHVRHDLVLHARARTKPAIVDD